ncbi:MAG: restriction endonuclease [Candidatus Heimdallarchaeota archaeon]
MEKIRIKKLSYRFAENILNSKLDIKNEIEQILLDSEINFAKLSRPYYNDILKDRFLEKGWKYQPKIINEEDEGPSFKLDFLKERIGLHVAFTHSYFIGGDLLKFQIASYANYDEIDVGVYVTTTKDFQRFLRQKYNLTWEGSLTYEKVKEYLPYVKSTIQVPIYVLGIDI